MTEDGLEGFIPAPLTPVIIPKGDGIEGSIDPTGLPFNEILSSLQQAVAECIDADAAEMRREGERGGGEEGGSVGDRERAAVRYENSTVAHYFSSLPFMNMSKITATCISQRTSLSLNSLAVPLCTSASKHIYLSLL